MLRIIQINDKPDKKTMRKKGSAKRFKKAARIVKKLRKRIKKAKTAKIVRVRKNPVRVHRTMIVGYRSVLKRKGKLKGVRYYFTGTGFSKDREAAEIFAGDKAKMTAHRIVSQLPSVIERIQVEPV